MKRDVVCKDSISFFGLADEIYKIEVYKILTVAIDKVLYFIIIYI